MASRLVSLAVMALLSSVACGGNPSATSPTPSLAPSPSTTASSSPSANPSPTPPATACGAPAITPAASAPALVRASIAYDKASQQFILLGVRDGGTVSETWAWTSASGWQHLAPANNPPARTWGNMAYDDATQQVVLFGGQSATPSGGALNPLTDTWTWDGTNWTQRAPAQKPRANVFMSMAYDPDTQSVIGVYDDASARGTETWEWNGSSWAPLQAGLRPEYPKQQAGLAYSTVTAVLVEFGTVFGIGAPAADANTWTYAAGLWTPHAPSAATPKARSAPAMSQDTGGGILMFGGAGSGGTVYGDTWSWAHNAWQKKSPSSSPRARSGAVMAYDSTCGKVLLYGGEVSTQVTASYFKDTWLWDGQTWTRV